MFHKHDSNQIQPEGTITIPPHQHFQLCEHDVKYCAVCDVAYCTMCGEEWRRYQYWQQWYPSYQPGYQPYNWQWYPYTIQYNNLPGRTYT